MIKFKNLPEDDRCGRCDHECNEDCSGEMTPNLCKILGVRLEEEFQIDIYGVDNPCRVVMIQGIAMLRDRYNMTVQGANLYGVIQSPQMYVKQAFSEFQMDAFKALYALGYKYVFKHFTMTSMDEPIILFSSTKPYRKNNTYSWVTDSVQLNIEQTNLDPDLFDFIKEDDNEPFEILPRFFNE